MLFSPASRASTLIDGVGVHTCTELNNDTVPAVSELEVAFNVSAGQNNPPLTRCRVLVRDFEEVPGITRTNRSK